MFAGRFSNQYLELDAEMTWPLFVFRSVAMISSRVLVVSSLSDIFHDGKIPRGVLWWKVVDFSYLGCGTYRRMRNFPQNDLCGRLCSLINLISRMGLMMMSHPRDTSLLYLHLSYFGHEPQLMRDANCRDHHQSYRLWEYASVHPSLALHASVDLTD